jgi:hypothetical protein
MASVDGYMAKTKAAFCGSISGASFGLPAAQPLIAQDQTSGHIQHLKDRLIRNCGKSGIDQDATACEL